MRILDSELYSELKFYKIHRFRHEALHDDVTEHERTKEKKFEEEMEVRSFHGSSDSY